MKSNKKKILIYVALILISCIVGFPIFWMLAMSFRSNVEIFKVPPSLIPEKFTFEPYIEILSNTEYLNFFKNSYFIAIIVTLFSLVVAFPGLNLKERNYLIYLSLPLKQYHQ